MVQVPVAPAKAAVPRSISSRYGTPVLGILARLVERPERPSPLGPVNVKVPVPDHTLALSIVPQYADAKFHAVPSVRMNTSSRWWSRNGHRPVFRAKCSVPA